jgi:hypothetical protein
MLPKEPVAYACGSFSFPTPLTSFGDFGLDDLVAPAGTFLTGDNFGPVSPVNHHPRSARIADLDESAELSISFAKRLLNLPIDQPTG